MRFARDFARFARMRMRRRDGREQRAGRLPAVYQSIVDLLLPPRPAGRLSIVLPF